MKSSIFPKLLFRRNYLSNLFKNDVLVRCVHTSRLLLGIEFTSARYPALQRGNYGVVSEEDISDFKRLLPGAERVITNPDELEGHNTDWVKNCRGTVYLLIF